ncbi:site-specific integrase [Amycolatopsis taiwanensis]|uniref:Site-specific integrase n=1 Tax=Amycolatopsis taiwanensis TaxID=342230 RepID=A0A9W6R7U6_9PSEU|nr:site-specific integrase [Amycolatopsis taiwanensis]
MYPRDAALLRRVGDLKDGKWHGRVTVGVRDDGKPDRRHIERKTEAEVIDAVRALEKQRDAGKVKKPGRAWTVEKWLTHWFENIAAPSVRYKAANAYRTAVYRHLVPNLGAHRIDKIEPEHFEKLYAKMRAAGLKAGTAHQVHRTARTAFGEALRRGHIVRNPVELAKAPRIEETDIEPFEADEIGQLLVTALSKRNGVRFVLALALGTRQGETIGLKWSRLDKRNKALRIAKQLQRQTWKHGCDDPHACGATYHKTTPCKEGCKRHHRKPCPPPCPPGCTSHARWCPKRHGGGLVEVDVKSRAGRRGIVLADRLYDLLIAHEEQQTKERELAGSEWHEGAGCSPSRTGSRSTHAATSTTGRRFSTRPGCGRLGCTTHGTPPRPCCSCLACPSEQSWNSWAGRTPAWRSATST